MPHFARFTPIHASIFMTVLYQAFEKKYSKYLFILNIFFNLCGIFYTKCKTLKIEEGEI